MGAVVGVTPIMSQSMLLLLLTSLLVSNGQISLSGSLLDPLETPLDNPFSGIKTHKDVSLLGGVGGLEGVITKNHNLMSQLRSQPQCSLLLTRPSTELGGKPCWEISWDSGRHSSDISPGKSYQVCPFLQVSVSYRQQVERRLL